MPAAAVIPAPIAYINVVAVKKARSWISVEDDRSALWVCIRVDSTPTSPSITQFLLHLLEQVAHLNGGAPRKREAFKEERQRESMGDCKDQEASQMRINEINAVEEL